MSNPYDNLPETAFWRSAVGQKHFSEIGPLWLPKFDLRPEQPVATFGSCFAQNIGRALQKRNFNWLNTEPAPPGLSEAETKRFNYNVFTSRTANIYTTTLLLQWTRWALLDEQPPQEVWEKDGRFFDPFRPRIEPDGFASIEELLALRATTIKAFGEAIRTADYFVFTMGLTESWRNRQKGYEYPMCPGTAAGVFDEDQHEFHNLDIFEIVDSLREALTLMRKNNRKLRIILTVSPVPLTATNSGEHVLVATTESKSILRAAAGHLMRLRPYVDYFPSYEIVTSPIWQGTFFETNKREISQYGVDFVMDHFFSCLQQKFGRGPGKKRMDRKMRAERSRDEEKSRDDVVCEEELLAAFGPQG